MKLKSFCLGAGLVLVGVIIAVVVIAAILFPAKRTYSSAQINTAFSQAVANNRNGINPMIEISINLQQDKALVTGRWQNGEILNSEIVVSADGKSLLSQNVVISGSTPLGNAILEKVANVVIQAGLDNVVARQGQFKSARIEPGQIVVTYR
jgi:hypothetical protein